MPQIRATSIIAFVIAILIALVIADFRYDRRQLDALTEAHRQHLEQYLTAARMRQSTDDLTRLARTYAVTRDIRFKEQFDDLLAKRRGTSPEPMHYDWVYWDYLAVEGENPPSPPTALKSYTDLLGSRDLTDEERRLLTEARQKSDELAALEKEVLASLQDVPVPTALGPLFDRTYHQHKLEILSRVNSAFRSISDRANERIITARAALDRSRAFNRFLLLCLSLASALWLMLRFRSQTSELARYRLSVEQSEGSLKASNEKLATALNEIRALERLLPICSYCHSIRDEDGQWHSLEQYMADRATISFSHGICPHCRKEGMADAKPLEARATLVND